MIRWLWRAAALTCAAVIGWRTTEQPSDFTLFARAGRSILTGHFGDVYADSTNQAGPLQQLLARALTIGTDDARPAQLSIVVLDALLMLAAIEACRLWRPSPRIALREVAVAGYTAASLANPAFWGGHPIEVLIPICWLAAGRAEARPAIRALVLAAAAMIAPWGVLGFPVVLDRRRWRQSAMTLGVAAGLTAAVYAPILLAGRGGSLHYRWGISSGSVVHLLDPGLHSAGWGLRLAQGAVVLLLGSALRWWVPPTPVGAAVSVTAICLLRVATDPLTMYYYWMPATVGVVAMVIVAEQVRRWGGIGILIVGYVVLGANALGLGMVGAVSALCLLPVIVHFQRPERPSNAELPTGGRLPESPVAAVG